MAAKRRWEVNWNQNRDTPLWNVLFSHGKNWAFDIEHSINYNQHTYCAAEAVFCYTAENSHHLEAQVITKNPLFQEEKISVRRMARCQVTSEKSSKNYISLFGGKPARGLPTPPPTSPRAVTAHFTRVGWQSASWMCEIYTRESLGGGGEGGVICETLPFVNGTSDRLQAQNQDSQYHSAPLLFRQDLSISFWWPLASFGEFI